VATTINKHDHKRRVFFLVLPILRGLDDATDNDMPL
jgi:hypothetical protein